MTTNSIKGTKTEQCILQAYISESTSYTRYTFYAQQADKENYFPIGEIFRRTAQNELHHSKIFFKLLEGGNLTVPATMAAGIIGDTKTNLQYAIDSEKAEGVDEYHQAAAIARQEGFNAIAQVFEEIAEIEQHHKDRFERYLKQVTSGTVWKRPQPIKWRCLVCGYEFEGTQPPMPCPACSHPYQHYMSTDPADN